MVCLKMHLFEGIVSNMYFRVCRWVFAESTEMISQSAPSEEKEEEKEVLEDDTEVREVQKSAEVVEDKLNETEVEKELAHGVRMMGTNSKN